LDSRPPPGSCSPPTRRASGPVSSLRQRLASAACRESGGHAVEIERADQRLVDDATVVSLRCGPQTISPM
jgi:hypothetical protein